MIRRSLSIATAQKTQAAPRQTTKHANFVKLARQRVTAALGRIDPIVNLANRSNYDYDDVEAEKIVTALEGAVQRVADAFASGGKNNSRFDF